MNESQSRYDRCGVTYDAIRDTWTAFVAWREHEHSNVQSHWHNDPSAPPIQTESEAWDKIEQLLTAHELGKSPHNAESPVLLTPAIQTAFPRIWPRLV
jgi:hypothetical protein